MKFFRYRVMGYINTQENENTTERVFSSKGFTIFQTDDLSDALERIKVIAEQNPECTRFEIERGEWA